MRKQKFIWRVENIEQRVTALFRDMGDNADLKEEGIIRIMGCLPHFTDVPECKTYYTAVTNHNMKRKHIEAGLDPQPWRHNE